MNQLSKKTMKEWRVDEKDNFHKEMSSPDFRMLNWRFKKWNCQSKLSSISNMWLVLTLVIQFVYLLMICNVITRVSVNVLIVISDPEIPKNWSFIEIAQRSHVFDAICSQVLTSLHLKVWIKKKYYSFLSIVSKGSFYFGLIVKAPLQVSSFLLKENVN